MSAAVSMVGWGVFCACSWTWCIGMYLPHIMLDRYGWWGFVVFAAPNVIGCSLFGYVLGSPARSRALVQRHRSMMRLFSWATIAFHVYFAAFAMRALVPESWGAMPVTLGGLLLLPAAAGVALLGNRGGLILTAIVYAISLMVFARIGIDSISTSAAGAQPMAQLPWLAPVIVIGFLCCPYMDLTFHRALQQSPGRHAFAVFGVTFALMLLLTVAYRPAEPGRLAPLVFAHLIAQGVFTTGVHLRELLGPREQSPARAPMLIGFLAVAAIVVVLLAADPLRVGRDTYLRFLVFYGLVFPAYVLLFIGPRARLPLQPRTLGVFIVIVLLLLPIYELGFIHHHTLLLLLPAGMAGGWVMRGRSRDAERRRAT